MSRSFQIEDELQRQRLSQWLVKQEPPFQIEFGPIREQRSLSQNARLWALHQLASKETGYDPSELHELMLCRFFGTKEIEIGGMKRNVPLKRSSTREKGEFREFLENVENFYASELGVWLGQEEAA